MNYSCCCWCDSCPGVLLCWCHATVCAVCLCVLCNRHTIGVTLMWPLQLHLGISGASAHRCFIENEKFLQNAVVRVSPISISCVRVTFIKQSQNLVLWPTSILPVLSCYVCGVMTICWRRPELHLYWTSLKRLFLPTCLLVLPQFSDSDKFKALST